MAEQQPPTLLGLDMADPTASVRDPALSSLIGAGWKVAASLPAQRGDRQEWLLLLTPPDSGPTVPHTVRLTAGDRAILTAVAVGQVLCITAWLSQVLGG